MVMDYTHTHTHMVMDYTHTHMVMDYTHGDGLHTW
jgi:hypothetical protein